MKQHMNASNGTGAPPWVLVCGAVLVLAVVTTCAAFAILFFQSPKGGTPALACAWLAGVVLVWAFRVARDEYQCRTRDSVPSATADRAHRRR